MCFEHKFALVKCGDSVLMFLDFYMLESGKNSSQISLFDGKVRRLFLPENFGKTLWELHHSLMVMTKSGALQLFVILINGNFFIVLLSLPLPFIYYQN